MVIKMIKTSKQIKNTLKNIWPIRDVWLVDPNYFLLSIDVVEKMIEGLSNKKMDYISNVWDCDNFSLLLNAEVKNWQYTCLKCSPIDKQAYTWAFGECLCSKVDGKIINHAINIAICKEGVFLIEPQNDKIWLADKDKDKLYFIKM